MKIQPNLKLEPNLKIKMKFGMTSPDCNIEIKSNANSIFSYVNENERWTLKCCNDHMKLLVMFVVFFEFVKAQLVVPAPKYWDWVNFLVEQPKYFCFFYVAWCDYTYFYCFWYFISWNSCHLAGFFIFNYERAKERLRITFLLSLTQ